MIPPPPPPGLHHAALAYTNPLFQSTSDLARRVAQGGRFRGPLRALARQPVTTYRSLLAIWRLPVVHMVITRRHAAVWFAPVFPPVAGPIFCGHRGQAVLDLAPDDDEYLTGRRKQALRTNLRRARKLGVHVDSLTNFDQWLQASRHILSFAPGGLDLIEKMRPPPATQEMGYFVATDEDGYPVAFSLVAVFDDYAALIRSVSLAQHPAASSARYLLHTAMRSDLRRRGVRLLVTGSGILISPGLQYFQHLLGYEMRNLRITVADAPEATSLSWEHRTVSAPELV